MSTGTVIAGNIGFNSARALVNFDGAAASFQPLFPAAQALTLLHHC